MSSVREDGTILTENSYDFHSYIKVYPYWDNYLHTEYRRGPLAESMVKIDPVVRLIDLGDILAVRFEKAVV